MKLRRIACLLIACCILFSTAAPAMAAELGDAKAIGVLLLEAAASIKDEDGEALAKASAGELLEVLYADKNSATVRRDKTTGVLSMKNAKLFDGNSSSIGTAEAISSVTLYSGPGSKYKKLGSLKKGASADVLGAYSSYTLLRAGDVIGLARTKSLKLQDEGGKSEPAAPTAPQAGSYVYTPKAAYVYTSARSSKAAYQMQAGTVLKAVKTDGDWLQVEVPGLRVWIESKNVKASPVVPGLSIDGYDSSQYNQAGLELIELVNTERKAKGAGPLKVDPVLMKAAEIRARELEISFTHLRPNGLSPSSIDFSIRSENMGRGRGAKDLLTAEQALKAFKGSSVHWANAMNKNYTRSGAAYVQINSIKYWVQLFG